jgi:para-nitrobenzyl esterase
MEIPFVFGDFSGGFFGDMFANSPNKDGLSASMMSYWTQFAVSGDPGRGRDGEQVEWKSWGEDGARSLVLDTVDDRGIRMIDDVVTLEDLKAELAAEPGLDTEGRCRLYVSTFGMFGLDKDEYRTFGPEGCDGFDPSQFGLF